MASNVWHCLGKTGSIFFGIIIGIPMGVVIMSICSIISALLLPPSLILYYMTHLAQISRNCRADSKKKAEFRGGLAHLIAACFLLEAFFSLIWLLIFRYSPGLKHRNIHDLPIWKWVAVLEVICLFGICTMEVGMSRYVHLIFPNLNVDWARSIEGLTGLASCGFILAAVLSVIRVAPVLKQPTILGLQATKWLLVILLVLLAHNAIRVLTSLAAASLRIYYQKNNDPSVGSPSQNRQLLDTDFDLEALLCMIRSNVLPSKETREWRRLHVVYFAQGLSRSINFLLTSLLFLLTWILYFGSQLNRTSASIREAYDYVTWTLVCIFIISIFWLVKDAIVLSWEARVVYDRFHVEISQRSTQLWLLGILGGRKFDILDIDWNMRHEGLDEVKSAEIDQRDHNGQDGEDQRDKNKGTAQEGDGKDHCEIDMVDEKSADEHSSSKDDNNGQEPKTPTSCGPMENNIDEAQGEEISSNTKTLDALRRARIRKRLRRDEDARRVLVPSAGQKDRLPIHIIEGMAAYFLAAEGSLSKKSYVSDFCKKWDLINGHSNIHENKPPIMDLDEKEIEEKAVKELCSEIQSSEIQNNTFNNWIKTAHKSTLDLARSLSGAKEVVDSLNQIIAWLITVLMIVIWLLLTGIATTKVIAFIAAPVLAASFIFGDTCKSIFQGFMFAYVLHPFTVGDRCTINGSSEIVEVMRIGIWKTIFSKIGSKGEVIYPNSVLASSHIVNLTGIDLDHDDELTLITSICNTEIDRLKQHIKRLATTKINNNNSKKKVQNLKVSKDQTISVASTNTLRKNCIKLRMLKGYADGMEYQDFITIHCPKVIMDHEYDVLIDRECINIVHKRDKVENSIMAAYNKIIFDKCEADGISTVGLLCPDKISNPIDNVEARARYLSEFFCSRPEKKLFFGPFHLKNHWMLFVVYPASQLCYWLDSLHGNVPDEAKQLMNMALEMYQDHIGFRTTNSINWEIVEECPTQPNSNDCGYYVMRFMKEIVSEIKTQPQIPRKYYPLYSGRTYMDQEIDEVREEWSSMIVAHVNV